MATTTKKPTGRTKREEFETRKYVEREISQLSNYDSSIAFTRAPEPDPVRKARFLVRQWDLREDRRKKATIEAARAERTRIRRAFYLGDDARAVLQMIDAYRLKYTKLDGD